MLIEEQVEGDNYRLLYLDGVFLDAFVRKLPTVVADGRSTVAKLVEGANADRLRHGSELSQVLLTVDLDMQRTLAKQGLSLRSIPAEGRVVTLKTVINENRGADNTSATHLLCDSIVEDGAVPPGPFTSGSPGSTSSRATPACPSRSRAGSSSRSIPRPISIFTTTSEMADSPSPSTSWSDSWPLHQTLRVIMSKMFDFDPARYTSAYAEQGYIHIPKGLTEEFYGLLAGQVEDYIKSKPLKDFAIGDKQQALYQLPDGPHYYRELNQQPPAEPVV